MGLSRQKTTFGLTVFVLAIVGALAFWLFGQGEDRSSLSSPSPSAASPEGVTYDPELSEPTVADPSGPETLTVPASASNLPRLGNPPQIDEALSIATNDELAAGEMFAIAAAQYLTYQKADTEISASSVESLFAEEERAAQARAYAESDAASQKTGDQPDDWSGRHVDLSAPSWVRTTISSDGLSLTTSFVAYVQGLDDTFGLWVKFNLVITYDAERGRWEVLNYINSSTGEYEEGIVPTLVSSATPGTWRQLDSP